MSSASRAPGRVRFALVGFGRRAAYAVATLLPAGQRETFLRRARRVGSVVGRRPRGATQPGGSGPTYRLMRGGEAIPRRWHLSPRPRAVTDRWAEPPLVDKGDATVRSIYHKGATVPRYDVELLESLNAEYESKRIAPRPPGLDAASRADRARRRLADVHEAIDLTGKRVLEIGCGAGYEVWYVAHHFGSDAYGVDVAERKAWDVLAGDRTHFECVDLGVSNPFPEKYFDRIISFTVWEHVTHPYAMLRRTFELLRPGGLAWINANLYRSAVGSHLYREIYFPFPHLLFSDDVIREFYRRRGEKERGASWVNKVTWAQYERYIDEIGFRVRMLKFAERPLDQEFYERFEDILGRYPKFDLKRDFFTVVLERPG